MDDLAKYYRAPWMSEDQWNCAQMFADVVGGFHHVTGKFKRLGDGVAISDYDHRWATFDYDLLTRLVVLAHDRMIRVALAQSGPGRVGFTLWKRHARKGSIFDRHPTLEDAIAMHRPRAAMADEIARLRAELAEAEALAAKRGAMLGQAVEALTEISGITERKKNCFPPDWSEQIAACPECRRYKDHPIQRGICDTHRRPIYEQEDHDRHETKILGYRAKDMARATLKEITDAR